MTLRPFRLITILEAIKLAELRNLEGSALGCNASTTYESDLAEFIARNVNGILAELVVGRKFNRFYLPSCNTFHKEADVGEDIGDADAGKAEGCTDATGVCLVSKTLMQWIESQGLDARLVMNALQDNGVCSDLCVEVEDVGNGGECLRWLLERDLREYRRAGK